MTLIANNKMLSKIAFLLASWSLLTYSLMAQANEIVVAIPEPEAPYYYRLQDKGAEMDVIRAAFKQAGHTVIPYYLVQYKSIPDLLDSGDIDCATSLTPFAGLHSFYSDPLIPHPFVAISLTSNRIKLNRVEDLQHIKFLPFLGATHELGDAYKRLITHLEAQKKKPKQTTATRMVNMLFRGDVPVIIMDKHIFEHNRDRFGHRSERMQKVDYHPIFEPLAHPLTCKSEQLSKKFNQSLRLLRKNGQYQAIIDRYFNNKKVNKPN